jgi:hypothetical protein
VDFFDKDGRHIKGDNLFLPHYFALYTANERWRRVEGPRGGKGKPPEEWRGYGEGGCFLLDFLTILKASEALKDGTTIVGDRLFTSFHLLKKLSAWGLFYVGTTKKNIKGLPEMEGPNDDRGSSVFRMCLSLVGTVCGWWRDSTWVLFLTVGWPWRDREHEVTRKQRGHREPVRVPCPLPATVYNKYMGPVDFFNREALTSYRGQLKCFRVWRHVFFTLFYFWIYIAYCLYVFAKNTCRNEAGEAVYPKLGVSGNKKFRLRLANELAKEQRGENARRKRWRKRKLINLSDVGVTVEEVLLHTAVKIRDMPTYTNRKAECAWCRATLRKTVKGKHGRAKKHAPSSSHGCAECRVGLHRGDCFILYHERLYANLKGKQPAACTESESDEDHILYEI